ncbi:MAG: glycine--tRNA ligase subunit beta [Candidatus Omnitrophica bacterium]|nr:glycine--tRNA ligase subunit beta [Candidatus Omnitrophota bacterium]
MKKNGPSSFEDILFEIGTEELPATNLADIFEHENFFEAKLKNIFEEHRLLFGEARVWATPRRIVCFLKKAASAQMPRETMTKLLSREDAYAADGSPSEKLGVILKHRNLTAKDLVVSPLNGKDTVFVKKIEPVQKTAALLPGIFEAFVQSLSFPKNMRWDDSGITFPRPIRSLLCFYGNKSIPLAIGNLRAKNETFIFSKSRRLRFAVKDIGAYFQTLKKNGVIPDPSERKKTIREELEKLARVSGAKLYEDAFLLSEVNFLVENPHALSAPFGEEFLKLPLEVLAVSMARKQRIFSVVDGRGRLLPRFLAVLDGQAKEKQKKAISKNMENILHAKLQDSLFFYHEDTKTPLEKKRAELQNLVFLKNAGSMLEKSDRLARLAKALAGELGLGAADQKSLERAAHLAKADLLSLMVGEFPELQGVMGKYYARENGEDEAVAAAIGEQYLPRTVSDPLPATPAGSALSVLDKADLVVTAFGLGLEPTSSLDPYGLRRSAAAIVKIVLERKMPLSLDRLFQEYRPAPAPRQKLEAFFRDRLKAVLLEAGYKEDVVEAVLACGDFGALQAAHRRVEALSAIVREPFFAGARKVAERTVNILKGNKEKLPDRIDPSLFAEELERRVFERYEQFQKPITDAVRTGDFRLATSLYGEGFFAILDQFFDKVFVNAEDLNVRRNRLALLRAVRDLYVPHVADLSRIQAGVS